MPSLPVRVLRWSLIQFRWYRLLPQTLWGDGIFAQLHCLRHNGYLPRTSGGDLTDFLAFLKGSPEIETALRKQLSDKATLKSIVAQRLGEDYCVPTYAVLQSDWEIDTFDFPAQCVIKPTHSSGQIIIRKAGEPIDCHKIKSWLRFNFYRVGRERNYFGLPPRIMVEEWLGPGDILEVKIHCYRGKPVEALMFHAIRGSNGQPMGIFYLDLQARVVEVLGTPAESEVDRQKLFNGLFPGLTTFGQLLEVAQKMSDGLLFARIDLYLTEAGIKVGEVTTSNNNGVFYTSTSAEQQRGLRYYGPAGFCLEDFPELSRPFWLRSMKPGGDALE